MKNTLIISVCSALFFIIHVELLFSRNTVSKSYKSESIKTEKKRNIQKTSTAPVIDGKNGDVCWDNTEWELLNHLWLGEAYDIKDFAGRYKLTWNEEALYLLVQIIDDKLYDQYPDAFKLWWDDDCVEIFVDSNNSGGDHLYSHNAFAYHVALDHNVVDLSTEKMPILFNEHIETAHVTQGKITLWEHKIYLFDETTFNEGSTENTPIQLKENQEIGFALAYCDNDNSIERENFIGSIDVEGEDKNQGYITADIFETILLTE